MQELQQMIADFSKDAVLTPELIHDRRTRIIALEIAMKQIPKSYDMAAFNPGKVKHHFGSGVYGRELFIPAGNVIVSKIHRGKTFNCIMQGEISVIDPVRGFNTYKAPHTFVSEPMTKRIVIAHTDVIWVTSHENPTNTEDLEILEKNITAESFLEIEGV